MREEYLIEIKGDVHDISDRIREVDEEYRLYYDPLHHRYEVRRKGELCVTWTEALSAALVAKLRETHVRRRYELLKEIEENEERMRREEEHRMHERIGEESERLMSRLGSST